MAAAFDTNDFELPVFLPAFLAEEAADLAVIGFARFVPSARAVVEVHSNSGGQCGNRGKSLKLLRVVRGALRNVPECCGETGKISKRSRVMDGGVEADESAQRGSTEDACGGLDKGAEAGVHVREKFRREKLRVGRAAELGREVAVPQGNVFFGEAFRMAHADHNGLGHHAAFGKKVHPFVSSPVHTGDRAGGGVKHVRAIVQHDERKAPLRLGAVALRQPDEQFAVSRQHPRADLFSREASTVAVLPIGYGVVHDRVQPCLAGKIPGNVPEGVHRFGLPGVSEELVFEARGCFDLSDVKRRLPSQGQAFPGLPVAQRRNAARNENSLVRAVDRGENLKTNFAHER